MEGEEGEEEWKEAREEEEEGRGMGNGSPFFLRNSSISLERGPNEDKKTRLLEEKALSTFKPGQIIKKFFQYKK